MDTVSKLKRSRIMSAIRSKDTKIERSFRKVLWRAGIRYRKNPPGYFGKPDIVLKKHKTVIFIDSCFWHGCRKHCRMPGSRKAYWKNKIRRNTLRDIEVNKYYEKKGWKIFRFWEHEIRNNINKAIAELKDSLQ